ncbi:MAG: helix-turn-helix transcriptional regulator [Atopobiaceae bacterium]|nr:helix-turn-helix transcriptional regulator [Atopobiaceae bacterium]
MADEPRTDDLLEQLKESASPEAYLRTAGLAEKSLSDYANELLEARGLRKADVARDSGLEQTYCYQMLSGARTKPSRDYVIKLAFGLHCDLTQAQRLLRRAGHSELWSKKARDAVIIHCIQHGRSRQQTDDELYRLGFATLVSPEG